MSDLTRPERLQIMLTREELKALDDWRFDRRMPSRAAAVRELLKRGLHAEGFEVAVPGKKSQAFGMTSADDGARNGVPASIEKQSAPPANNSRRDQRPSS
jgi:hypothetical protein